MINDATKKNYGSEKYSTMREYHEELHVQKQMA